MRLLPLNDRRRCLMPRRVIYYCLFIAEYAHFTHGTTTPARCFLKLFIFAFFAAQPHFTRILRGLLQLHIGLTASRKSSFCVLLLLANARCKAPTLLLAMERRRRFHCWLVIEDSSCHGYSSGYDITFYFSCHWRSHYINATAFNAATEKSVDVCFAVLPMFVDIISHRSCRVGV